MDAISNVGGLSPAIATNLYQTAATAQAGQGGSAFAQTLQQALEQEMTQKTIALTTPGAGGQLQTGGTGDIQQMLLSAAATGEAGDVEAALLMLCLMMQECEDSQLSSLMGAMAAMLGQMGDKTKSQAQATLLESGQDAYAVDTLDNALFGQVGAAAAQSGAVLPEQAWRAATPAVTNSEANRSPQALRAVIDQFEVESSVRYKPYRKGGDTYCNIFLWDVTRAMGSEIPHYVDRETGAPRVYPDVKGARELGANATYDWLAGPGEEYGWRAVSAQEAQAWANRGGMAVTAWKNPSGGSGHVQVVCPSANGGYDAVRGVTVAQAGANNTGYTHISATFSQSQLKDVAYYIHP